jgi:hypothetical protein
MKLIWVLVVFLQGTDIQEEVYFQDLDTCIEYSERIKKQNYHQRVAGDKIYVKAYCIPKKVEE